MTSSTSAQVTLNPKPVDPSTLDLKPLNPKPLVTRSPNFPALNPDTSRLHSLDPKAFPPLQQPAVEV